MGAVLLEPGRLCVGPTDLATAFPHGGYEIGAPEEAMWLSGDERLSVLGEESGGAVLLSLRVRKPAVLAVAFRQQTTAYARFLALLPGGSSTGSGSITEGTSASPQPGVALTRIKLLYAPNDTTNGRGVLLYAASVLREQSAVLTAGLPREYGRGCVFLAELDDNDRLYQDDVPLSGMTL